MYFIRCGMTRSISLLGALLVVVALASAQEIMSHIGLGDARRGNDFDEIEDARERRAFREVWMRAPLASGAGLLVSSTLSALRCCCGSVRDRCGAHVADET